MSTLTVPDKTRLKLGRIGIITIYLIYAAVVARTLTSDKVSRILSWYLGLELVFILFYSLAFLRPGLPDWLLHPYFVVQSTLVLWMVSLQPEFDFVVLLFVLLNLQALLFFSGWRRWAWIAVTILLTGGSLIFYLGFVKGLALALTTMAAEVVLPAYLLVNHETEAARMESQALLREVEEKHRQLEAYASQVEELAAMQERNRLARELHDTISQVIFSISLTARSAQLLLDKDPARIPEQLDKLQEMTAGALSQLRSLITQLRPPTQL